jgi:tight adherence protein C
MTPVLLLGLILLLGVGLIIFSLSRFRQPDAIGERLNTFTERAMTLEELELQQPFSQRVILPAAKGILAVLGK